MDHNREKVKQAVTGVSKYTNQNPECFQATPQSHSYYMNHREASVEHEHSSQLPKIGNGQVKKLRISKDDLKEKAVLQKKHAGISDSCPVPDRKSSPEHAEPANQKQPSQQHPVSSKLPVAGPEAGRQVENKYVLPYKQSSEEFVDLSDSTSMKKKEDPTTNSTTPSSPHHNRKFTIVRKFTPTGEVSGLRITVGTDPEIDQLLTALHEIV